jgi:peptide-methionine (R)-S-oxide reductase
MLSRRLLSAGVFAAAVAAVSRFFARDPAQAGADRSFEVARSEEEWKKILTPEQFYVLRKHGTERPFTSPLDKQYGAGIYNCAGCDLPLFASTTKFNSRTGWPSFYAPLDNAVGTTTDKSFFMARTEVHCRRCGGHLGHVFADGPKPTGLRYCMNGVSLRFVANNKPS